MSSTLLVYGTSEGQTKRIAETITRELTAHGQTVTAVNAAERPTDLDLEAFDSVIVGASIHAGKTQPAVREFVREHREAIEARPNAYFQVSLAAATEDGADQATEYTDRFSAETGWEPDRVEQVAGAVRFSEYGFLLRLLMRVLARRLLPGAPREDTEYTDWEQVEDFAAEVATMTEQQATA